ncbi:hypothetical protein DPMN_006664 [Dreissena polymorpha]|uniref:Uncharacterized protein n=1 Tax=Dreissena polymorpha TaxID=45954 RepID=A0A9D4RXL1_DREPO|nr:hypothetical protein DPMN_006664 [Dreissena polymorpha]
MNSQLNCRLCRRLAILFKRSESLEAGFLPLGSPVTYLHTTGNKSHRLGVITKCSETKELSRDIIRTSVLTKFHEDWTSNKTSRMFTRFYYSHMKKTALPNIIETNVMTKFLIDLTINVTSRVLTLALTLCSGEQKTG